MVSIRGPKPAYQYMNDRDNDGVVSERSGEGSQNRFRCFVVFRYEGLGYSLWEPALPRVWLLKRIICSGSNRLAFDWTTD